MNKNIIFLLVTIILLLPLAQAKIVNTNTEINGNEASIYKQPKFTAVNGYWQEVSDAISINYSPSTFTISAGSDYATFEAGLTYNNVYYKINESPTNSNPNFNVPKIKKDYSVKYDIVASLIGLNPNNINNVKLKLTGSSSAPIYYNDKIVVGKMILTYDDMLAQGYNYTISNDEITIGNIGANVIGNSMRIDPEVSLNDSDVLKDAHIEQALPNTNFGGDTNAKIESDIDGSATISIITWNLTGILPANATNITVLMNLSKQGGSSRVVRVFQSTNTIWDEGSITWNTFFCSVNSTGQILIGGSCPTLLTTKTTGNTNNDPTVFNLTGSVTPSTTLVTYVLDGATNDGVEWRHYTKEDGTLSRDPFITLKWDEQALPPPPPPPQTFQQLNTLDLSSCGQSSSDMDFHPNGKIMYVYMRELSGSFPSKIAIVNITNPNNMVLTSCITDRTTSGTLTSLSFNPVNPSLIDRGSVEGIISTTQLTGTSENVKLYNVTNDGTTIQNTFTINGGSSAFRIVRSDSSVVDISNLVCKGTTINTLETHFIDSYTGSTGLYDTNFSTTTCRGLSKGVAPFGFGGPKFSVLSSSAGQHLIRTGDFIQNDTSVIVNQPPDSVKFRGNSYAVFGDNIQLYNFNTVNESINRRAFISLGFVAGTSSGGLLPTNNLLITGYHNGVNVTMFEYNISDLNNPIVTTNQTINFTNTFSTADMEYIAPYLFIKRGNAITSIFYQPSSLNITNNKKPRINNLQTNTPNLALNQTATITYTIDNPETASSGEVALTRLTCDYKETLVHEETFDTGHDFSSTCNSSNIGNLNGFNFGLGLNLASCSNDFLLLPTSIANETIISFDVYAQTFTDNKQLIQLIDFAGSEIITLNISIDSFGLMDVRKSVTGEILLEDIDVQGVLSNIPTRIFIQLNPVTTNPNHVGRIFVSTNNYANSNLADIDKTFCDNDEFCYIGDRISTTNAYSNFFGLFLDNAESTGSIVLDNFRVKTTNQYGLYSSVTDLNIVRQCSYTTTGTKIARAYSSDVTFGHNYLYYRDLPITVTLTGLPPTLAGTPIENSSIGSLINEVAGASGFSDDGSLLILSLIFIGAMIFGSWRSTQNAIAGIFAGAFGSIFFFFLGWLPLVVMVIIVLLASGLIAFAMSNAFFGGGG